MRKQVYVSLLIGILFLAPGALFAKEIYEPSEGVYHGVWLKYHRTIRSEQILDFENHAGKEVALEIVYLGWYLNCFDDAQRQIDVFEPLGITPHIVWEPSFQTSPVSDVLLDIIGGIEDDIIIDMAQKCAFYGKPIFLRFAHEMNGDWYAWSGQECGGGVTDQYGDPNAPDGPEKYIDAFQYVRNKFDAAGATNVIWVWSPNADSVPDEEWNQLTNYYPGDDYVDWVGVDFYGLFWGDGDPFTQIGKVYDHYADRKPIMIGETAAADEDNYGGGGAPTTLTKPEWIERLFSVMETYYPRVKAFNWFNENKIGEADWRIESLPYPDSQDTYAAYVSNPRYLVALEGGVQPPLPGDFNHDGYVDQADMTVFDCCFTGPTVLYDPYNLPPDCSLPPDMNGKISADFDQDSDVDLADFGVFQRCYRGDGNPADPNCAD